MSHHLTLQAAKVIAALIKETPERVIDDSRVPGKTYQLQPNLRAVVRTEPDGMTWIHLRTPRQRQDAIAKLRIKPDGLVAIESGIYRGDFAPLAKHGRKWPALITKKMAEQSYALVLREWCQNACAMPDDVKEWWRNPAPLPPIQQAMREALLTGSRRHDPPVAGFPPDVVVHLLASRFALVEHPPTQGKVKLGLVNLRRGRKELIFLNLCDTGISLHFSNHKHQVLDFGRLRPKVFSSLDDLLETLTRYQLRAKDFKGRHVEMLSELLCNASTASRQAA